MANTHQVCMVKIVSSIMLICLLGCVSRREDKTMSKLDSVAFEDDIIVPDTCSFCSMDSFLIKPVSQDVKTKITIDFPVAIVLFDRVELVHKYELDNYDTLMKVFKMKHWGDRNEIYRLYDLYGYYSQGIRPILNQNKVSIIDTIKKEKYVTIIDKSKKYVVDLSYYRQDDGVLMFRPGKSPIYWTMRKDEQYCFDYYGFPKWYFSCNNEEE